MINIDWGLVQLQYELFHVSVEDLAEEYGTTPRMVEYIAEERNWKRSELALACQDYTHLPSTKQVSDSLLEKVKHNLSVLNTIKQSSLNPRYIALEAALLGKSLAMLQELATDDPSNATVLKVVAEILSSLREQNFGKPKQQATESKGLQINIMNRVTPDTESNENLTIDIRGEEVAPLDAGTPACAGA